MATKSFDFSQLTAAERIKLAEELWDSVEPADVPLSTAQASRPQGARAWRASH
jgi:hypothetical protein